MKEVNTEIEISASPQRVWQILTEFEKYGQWNPFIRSATGEAKEGAKIQIHVVTPGGKSRKYWPTVSRVHENKELRWFGKSIFLNGEHIFVIEELGLGRIRLVHREVFEGFLTSFFGKSMDEDVRAGFEQMNRALKERAEERTASQ